MRIPVKPPRRILKVGERFYMTCNYRVAYWELGKPHFEIYGTREDVTDAVNAILDIISGNNMPVEKATITDKNSDAKEEKTKNNSETQTSVQNPRNDSLA